MEELKEARKAIFFALTISVVWLLIAGAIKEELRTKKLVEEMGVWVLVSEALNQAYTEDRNAAGIYDYEGAFSNVPVGSSIGMYRTAAFDNRGNEGFEQRRLTVAPPWSPGTTIPFSLRRIEAPGKLEIFQITSGDNLIDSARYSVGVFRDGKPEVHSRVPGSVMESVSYHGAVFLEGGLRGPNSADAVFSYLWSKGWKGRTEADLSSRDPVVAKAITDVRQKRHTIASLPLTASLLPPAIGILLALSAFNLIGPTIRLRNRKVDVSEASWTFAIRAAEAPRLHLPVLQIVAAALCIGLLVSVLVSIAGFGSLLGPDERIFLYVGILGAALSIIVLTAFFWTVFARIFR